MGGHNLTLWLEVLFFGGNFSFCLSHSPWKCVSNQVSRDVPLEGFFVLYCQCSPASEHQEQTYGWTSWFIAHYNKGNTKFASFYTVGSGLELGGLGGSSRNWILALQWMQSGSRVDSMIAWLEEILFKMWKAFLPQALLLSCCQAGRSHRDPPAEAGPGSCPLSTPSHGEEEPQPWTDSGSFLRNCQQCQVLEKSFLPLW